MWGDRWGDRRVTGGVTGLDNEYTALHAAKNRCEPATMMIHAVHAMGRVAGFPQ